MANVLVTGGAGFIGSHLTDRLIAFGHEVTVFDNMSTGSHANIHPQARLVVGDIRNAPAVRHAMMGMDAVFHLAAIASVQKSTEDWVGTHSTNSAGTVTVFDAARETNEAGPIPVVYASSAAVYGVGNSEAPITEQDPTCPLTAYGADKLSNELQARAAGIVHGLPTFGLRFFNVYGPRQDPKSPYSGVISIFSDRIADGRDITVFGDGEQTRDFIYVDDIVDHLLAAWSNAGSHGPVANACTGSPISLNSLISVLSTVLGCSPEVHYAEPRKGDIRHSVGNSASAQDQLGIIAKTDLQNGLTALVGAPRRLAA